MTIFGRLPGRLAVACTLPSAQQPVRAAEWDEVFAHSVRRVTRTSSTSLELDLVGDPAPVWELAMRETDCCSFFDFTLNGSTLRIEVPAQHADVLSALAAMADSGPGR
jgi:hypothetical protein